MDTPVIVGQIAGWVTVEGLSEDQEDDLYEYLETACGYGQTLMGAIGSPYKFTARGVTLAALTEKVRKYLKDNAIPHRVL